MNQKILIFTLLAALTLTACDKPTIVNVPAETVVVPGPAGPPGDPGVQGDPGIQGNQGEEGYKGDTGDAGVDGEAGSTVIVIPPSDPNTPPSD